MGANLGRLIGDYRTLVEACRARADELEISRLEIDRLGGLPPGYAGKLLGKDGGAPGRKHKKMWPVALESMLGVLGLKILLIEDDAATAARWPSVRRSTEPTSALEMSAASRRSYCYRLRRPHRRRP
jgi:hypothetical protein